MKQIAVHCDGACLGNGSLNARAGWGVVVSENDALLTSKNGKVPGAQTSIRAEIYAFLQALLYIQESAYTDVVIATDSYEVVMAVTGKTKRNSNRDIWVAIEKASLELACRNIKVKHCNKKVLDPKDVYYRANVKADLLAFEGAQKLFDLLEE